MPLNKRKEITLTTTQPTRMWLTLISGLTGFTEREMDVLEVIIDKRIELVNNGIKQPYLSEMLFSTLSRKEYYSRLMISEFNFTNLLGTIRKKRGIVKLEDGIEDVDSRLIPATELLIKLIVPNDRGTADNQEDS